MEKNSFVDSEFETDSSMIDSDSDHVQIQGDVVYAYINFGSRFRDYTQMLWWAIEWGHGTVLDFEKQPTGTLFRVSYLRSDELALNAAIAPFMPEFWS